MRQVLPHRPYVPAEDGSSRFSAASGTPVYEPTDSHRTVVGNTVDISATNILDTEFVQDDAQTKLNRKHEWRNNAIFLSFNESRNGLLYVSQPIQPPLRFNDVSDVFSRQGRAVSGR